MDTAYTTGHGDATRLTTDAASKGYRAVIAAGGDGTVNEIATALCGTSTALGIIPVGSGNGLARHLGLPLDVTEAIEVIAKDNIIDCDYGTANGRPFFCTFGVGFDAAVSEKFAHQKRRGKLSYIKSAISEYVSYNPQTYTISANGQILTQKAFIVACCNASQYGNNAYIAPTASITDGLLDITIGACRHSARHGNGGSGSVYRLHQPQHDDPHVPHIVGRDIPLGTGACTSRRRTGDDGRRDDREVPPQRHCASSSPGESRFRPIITPVTSSWRNLRRPSAVLYVATVNKKSGLYNIQG